MALRSHEHGHAAARHASQHEEAPEVIAKALPGARDEGLGEGIRDPRDDGLQRTRPVAGRVACQLPHVARLQRRHDAVEDASHLLTGFPLGPAPQQVLLGDHLEDRAHVLSQPAVNQHNRIGQPLCRSRMEVLRTQDAVARQQTTQTDAELGVTRLRQCSLDDLQPGPKPSRVLPASAGAPKPLAENGSRSHQAPLVLEQGPAELGRLPCGPHEGTHDAREQIGRDRQPRAFGDVVHVRDELEPHARPNDAREQARQGLPGALERRRNHARGDDAGLQ